MKISAKITIVLFAILSAMACSKDKMPSVADNEFAIKLDGIDNLGHYGYMLQLVKGNKFKLPLLIEIQPQGCTGNIMVSGKEYIEAISVEENNVKIEYLPYSAGNHKVIVKVTGGGKSLTEEININGVTALEKNEIILPFEAKGFNPGLGDNLFTVKNDVLKIARDFFGKTDKLDWVAQGTGFVYKTINKINTGCKISADKFVALQAIIAEVNGIRCDQTGIKEIEDICSYKNKIYNKIKFIGIYPANASNYNPIINLSVDKDGKHIIGKNSGGLVNINEVIGQEFEFEGASGAVADGTVLVFDIGRKNIIQKFALWNWKK